jgi:hypothetical protein
MSPPFQPLQLLLVIFAGWVNRHQLDVIELLQEENRFLKKRLGGRRICLTDAERWRLARKAIFAPVVLAHRECQPLTAPRMKAMRDLKRYGCLRDRTRCSC